MIPRVASLHALPARLALEDVHVGQVLWAPGGRAQATSRLGIHEAKCSRNRLPGAVTPLTRETAGLDGNAILVQVCQQCVFRKVPRPRFRQLSASNIAAVTAGLHQ